MSYTAARHQGAIDISGLTLGAVMSSIFIYSLWSQAWGFQFDRFLTKEQKLHDETHKNTSVPRLSHVPIQRLMRPWHDPTTWGRVHGRWNCLFSNIFPCSPQLDEAAPPPIESGSRGCFQ